MKNKKEAIEILEILKKYYPDATCSLDFKTPFQILIAVMLSAQCTDERVNKTTPLLFKNYGTPEKMSKMDLKVLEDISAFLDNFLKTSTFYRVNMKEILTHLSDNGYNAEDTKAVSQLNYLLMDLTNARKNRNIDEHRLDIRVIYIKERFQTYFKSEFHEQIDKMFATYNTLFALSKPQQTKGNM